MVERLAKRECIPCRGDIPPLKGETLTPLYKQLDSGWKVIQEHHLEKEYIFKNFKDALVFTTKVGNLAEAEKHHPDILLSWGRVLITLWTHKINGLSESDFILAAKIDEL